MQYFTGDQHFRNPFALKSRPQFGSLEEMHGAAIDGWNRRVRNEDTVFVEGDLATGGDFDIAAVVRLLNGKIVLVQETRDLTSVIVPREGGEYHPTLVLERGDETIRLSHLPPSEEEAAKYDYCFCGHVHKEWARRGNVINVGVDVRGFEPRTLEELLAA